MKIKSVVKNCYHKSISMFHAEYKKHPGAAPLTLYLHIGMPKTGSTAIQQFLHHNRLSLQKDYGVLYPESATHWHQHAPIVKSIVSQRFSWAHFNKLMPTVNLTSWGKELISHCRKIHCNSVVLSSEFFWAAPSMQAGLQYHEVTPENLGYLEQVIQDCQKVFSMFDSIKIIVYLRRQENWLESFFNHQLKDGFPIPIEEELLPAKLYLLYYENLKLWTRYFGHENIIVHLYEDTSRNVIENFCTSIGINSFPRTKGPAGTIQPSNPRLSPRAVHIMRQALNMQLDKDVISLLQEVLKHTSSQIDKKRWPTDQGLFSNDFHKNICAIYAQDNRKLAGLYPSTQRFLEKESNPLPSITMNDLDELTPEEQVEQLLELVIPAIQQSQPGPS